MEGGTARTAESSWPRGYPTPNNIMLNSENILGVRGRGSFCKALLLRDLMVICMLLEGGEWLSLHHFLFLFLYLIRLFLSHPVSFFHCCTSDLLLHPSGEVWVNSWWVLSCWPGSTCYNMSVPCFGEVKKIGDKSLNLNPAFWLLTVSCLSWYYMSA